MNHEEILILCALATDFVCEPTVAIASLQSKTTVQEQVGVVEVSKAQIST